MSREVAAVRTADEARGAKRRRRTNTTRTTRNPSAISTKLHDFALKSCVASVTIEFVDIALHGLAAVPAGLPEVSRDGVVRVMVRDLL